jgi:hypothetical protein
MFLISQPLSALHASRAAYLATRAKGKVAPQELDFLRELRAFCVEDSTLPNATPDGHLVLLIDELLAAGAGTGA